MNFFERTIQGKNYQLKLDNLSHFMIIQLSVAVLFFLVVLLNKKKSRCISFFFIKMWTQYNQKSRIALSQWNYCVTKKKTHSFASFYHHFFFFKFVFILIYLLFFYFILLNTILEVFKNYDYSHDSFSSFLSFYIFCSHIFTHLSHKHLI